MAIGRGDSFGLMFFCCFFPAENPCVLCARDKTRFIASVSLFFFFSFISILPIHRNPLDESPQGVPFFFSCSQNELRSCTSSPCLFLLFPCCCCCFFFKRRICVTICGNSCSRTSGSALTRRHRRCCEICQCAAVR